MPRLGTKDTGPPTEEELVRQLKIKVGVVKRLAKEVASYEKEATTQEAKIQGMKDQGRDIYEIKKQEEVLQESYMMIPDSKARYQSALEDLQAFLDENESSKELEASELYGEAKGLIAPLVEA